MKPLHIAILAPTFLPKCSGAEVFHHNLAGQLVGDGHRVTVVAPRARVRQLRARGWDLPYALVSYPDKRWNWLKRHLGFACWLNRRALDSLQRRHRFDVWHAFVLYPAGVVLADWQRRSGVPGLVRAVGDDVSGLPSQGHSTHVARALRDKLPSAGALVALCHACDAKRGRSRLHAKAGMPSSRGWTATASCEAVMAQCHHIAPLEPIAVIRYLAARCSTGVARCNGVCSMSQAPRITRRHSCA